MAEHKAEHKKEELMELKHEPVPGYGKALFWVLAVGIVYLGLVFLFGGGQAAGH